MKQIYIRSLPLLLLISCLVTSVMSQPSSTKASGVVVDSDGQPLIGVTIVDSQNPRIGAISDGKGEFAINLKEGSSLDVSYVGYASQMVRCRAGERVRITLLEEATQLDEVIVVGYGTMRKSDLTGSVTSVSVSDIQQDQQSLAQALQGKVAGLQISTTSAAPGGSVSMTIRGTNSLFADSAPLIVVDGFADVSMSSVNTADIESIQVLKDASSTAIYGSRGANGVILITTKKASLGRAKVSFSSSFGVQDVYREFDLMNGEEFATIFNEFQVSEGGEPYYDGSTRLRPTPEQVGEGTDWFKQIMRVGSVQNHNLSISGGTDLMNYRISGGYYRNDGVILGGDYERLNFNLNSTIKIAKWLDLNTIIAVRSSTTNSSGDRSDSGTLNYALRMSPAIPVYDGYGDYSVNTFPNAITEENPVAIAEQVLNESIDNNLMGNFGFDFKIMKDLSLLVKFGLNVGHGDGVVHNPTTTVEGGRVGGTATRSNSKRVSLMNDYVLNYRKEWEKHRLSGTLGGSIQRESSQSNSIKGTGLASDETSWMGIAGATTVSQPSVSMSQSSMLSAFIRVNYNYDNRYLVTVSSRADGNSVFADGNKWGVFSSAAVAWRLNNEKFMKSLTLINDLKLRLSVGQTGNSKVGNYRSQSLLEVQRYPMDGVVATGGFVPSTVGNEDFTWETTTMYNVGLDFALWKMNISGSLDLYYKRTDDMIMNFNLPLTSGYAKAYLNAGSMENKGVDFSLNAVVLKSKNFQWRVGAQISANRDKVLELYDGQELTVECSGTKIFINEGYPIRQFEGKESLGIFQNQAEVDAYTWVNPATGVAKPIIPDSQPGDIKWADRNNDGTINYEDNIIYGTAFPRFSYGASTQLRYKGLVFDLFVTASEGGVIHNKSLGWARTTNMIRGNLSAEVADRWTPTNTDATYPRLGAPSDFVDYEDASYVRIQNIALTYNIPKSVFANRLAMSVSLSVDNLYVWTQYSGWDPDVNSTVGGNDNINVGTDQNSFPKPRTWRIGLNLNF